VLSNQKMLAEKNGQSISTISDWKQFAAPKSADQWRIGRSAYELAHAWCGRGHPSMPSEVRALLDSRDVTSGVAVERIFPEYRIAFDSRGGEPRNADLAFVGHTTAFKIAVTIEAKADEPFGATLGKTMAAALERKLENPRSQGIERVVDLARALMHPRSDGEPQIGRLRYQLFAATAGTLAYALEQGAMAAVLIVHEFVTDKTRDGRLAQNSADYREFLRRLCRESFDEPLGLLGPIAVPGTPLFPASLPLLFIGKITTDRRHSGAASGRQ
jgi:hypothetical protein